MNLLRQVARKQSMRRRDGSWRKVPAEEMLKGVGIQTIRTYVARQQATVAEWVATWPIFDVCALDT